MNYLVLQAMAKGLYKLNILSIFLLLFLAKEIPARTQTDFWSSKPTALDYRVREDIILDWNIDEHIFRNVTSLIWLYAPIGTTLGIWTKEDGFSTYHQGRVDMLTGSNAGIVIRNGAVADSGNYRLAVYTVSDPAMEDIVMVTVYSAPDLLPELQVDNKMVNNGDVIEISKSSVILTVLIKHKLQTSTKMYIKDMIVASCDNSTVCAEVFSLDQASDITVTIAVMCSLCPTDDLQLQFVGESPKKDQVTGVRSEKCQNNHGIIALLAVLLLIALGLLVGQTIYFYRRKLMTRRSGEQHGCEEGTGLVGVTQNGDGDQVDRTSKAHGDPKPYKLTPNSGTVPTNAIRVDVCHDPTAHAGLDDFYLGVADTDDFLVSFMVDDRGDAMRGCRHSDVRIIVPPGIASAPTCVTCKLVKREKLIQPPPLMEGEALASRVLQMGPSGAQFSGPVIIEVPHFASLRGKEREIVILRSDNGETWIEHTLGATEETIADALNGSFEGEGDYVYWHSWWEHAVFLPLV